MPDIFNQTSASDPLQIVRSSLIIRLSHSLSLSRGAPSLQHYPTKHNYLPLTSEGQRRVHPALTQVHHSIGHAAHAILELHVMPFVDWVVELYDGMAACFQLWPQALSAMFTGLRAKIKRHSYIVSRVSSSYESSCYFENKAFNISIS